MMLAGARVMISYDSLIPVAIVRPEHSAALTDARLRACLSRWGWHLPPAHSAHQLRYGLHPCGHNMTESVSPTMPVDPVAFPEGQLYCKVTWMVSQGVECCVEMQTLLSNGWHCISGSL